MPELEDLTADHFARHKGETFQCRAADAAFDLRLEVAEEIKTQQKPTEGGRKSFSVTFRGPRDKPLGQGIVQLEHGEVGRHEIFLVPIAEDADGRYYEAVFT
jgi:hypothetical protein